MIRVAAVVATVWCVLAPAFPATAKERAGVFIVAEDERDSALADNLSEVALARVAEALHADLVGIRELRRLLADGGRDLPALPSQCLSEPGCVGVLRTLWNLSIVVRGEVTRQGRMIHLSLFREGPADGRPRQCSRLVDGDVVALIRAVQDGVAYLLEPAGGPPVNLTMQPPPAVTPLLDHPEARAAGGKHSWKPTVAYVSAGTSILLLSTAAIFGSLGQMDAQGSTRLEAQHDLERRSEYAHTANVLLIAAGVVSAIGVAAFVEM